MNVRGQHYRTIWPNESDRRVICVIDQRFLPHQFVIEEIRTAEAMAEAIRDMHVRGAGLIGAAAGYGIYLAALAAESSTAFDKNLATAATRLGSTRPTAVNLRWAIDRQLKAIGAVQSVREKQRVAFETAQKIADEDAESCRRIGEHGLQLIRHIIKKKGGAPVN